MKEPHEYLEDAIAVRALSDQAHDGEQHWQAVAETAVVLCLQDSRRRVAELEEQLLINAQALQGYRTNNGPQPRRIGEGPKPIGTYKGQPEYEPPF